MYVVVALRTETLQNNVTVETHEATEAFAIEHRVNEWLFVKHDVLQHVETLKVRFVEVVDFRLRDFFRSRHFLHFANGGISHSLHGRAKNAEEKKEIHKREKKNIDVEQNETEPHGDENKKDADRTQRRTVSNQIRRKLHATNQTVRQAEDVENVVAGKQQRHDAQKDVAGKKILNEIIKLIDAGKVAADRRAHAIDKNNAQSGNRISPHSSPLQITRHAQTKRINAQKKRTYHQINQHHRVQNPERRHHAAASKKGKPATVEQANEQHNPRLRQKMCRRCKFYIDQSEGVHGKNQRMKEKRALQKTRKTKEVLKTRHKNTILFSRVTHRTAWTSLADFPNFTKI